MTGMPKAMLLNGKEWRPDNSNILDFSKSEERAVIRFLSEWFDESDKIPLKTSGSTGFPKQIWVEKSALVESANRTIQYFGLQKGMKALLCLSPEFIAGKMMIIRSLIGELNLITTSFQSNPLFSLTEEIDFAAMVPLQISLAMELSPEKLPLIKSLILGGSAIGTALEESLRKLPNPVFHTYGMTETLSHIAVRRLNGESASQWFEAMPDVSLSLHSDGILVIDAPYLSIRELRTNDIAEFNAFGRFRIIGRADDAIISAANKIHPVDLEKKIYNLLGLKCYISARAEVSGGDSLVLVLEQAGSVKDLYRLWRQLESFLEMHEIPRFILELNEVPMLDSGKTDRRGLRQKVQSFFEHPQPFANNP